MQAHRFLLWVVVAVCLCTSTQSLRADSPSLCGIHWYSTDGDVESMTNNKGVWVLDTVMTYDGGWTASSRLSRMQTAVSRGHTIICRIQPQWGMAVPHENDMAAYINAVQQSAFTLRNVCHIWQIGNEMDNPGEYGNEFLMPDDYGDRFKQIRQAIKQVSSPLGEQMVILGPTSAFATWYLSDMLNSLQPSDVDGIAMHAYGVNPDLLVWNSIANFKAAVSDQLDVIDQYGFEYKPVFITEFDRCASPANDAVQEPVSSQFLYQAYAELNQWNQTPGKHPVIAAMWFIYPDDSSWSCYSLRYNKSGPRGKDVNMWDAFQYAAMQDYPAGGMQSALGVSVTSLQRETRVQSNPSSDVISVTNLGFGEMSYHIESDADWLQLTPTDGVSYSESDNIVITYDLATEPSAVYTATITVVAEGVAGSPVTIPVTVDVLPVPGDSDRDGDVDQTDFGLLQACLVPTGDIQSDPACRFANMDGDTDVDVNDIVLFQACMTGANISADPDCVASFGG